MGYGWRSFNISTCISKAVDNEFSGNMIDVCPVGALTDKTFRFKSGFGSTNPTMHIETAKLKDVVVKPLLDVWRRNSTRPEKEKISTMK
jgi:predicted molibdopterin-dependent oxidoreductase YjgC